jgi:hypothetical protein
VIAADETGRPQFYDLLRGTRAPAYVAFDIVWLNGADLRSLPLHERRRALQTILPNRSPIVSEALSVTHRGSELFDLMCANDLEGIVAKRLVDPNDTRVRWLKIKNRAYTQNEGRATCSMGRAIQPNAGPVGDAPRRSADDARQRRHGACAPYRVVQGMPSSGRARPRCNGRPLRCRDDGTGVARAAAVLAMPAVISTMVVTGTKAVKQPTAI